MAFRLQRTIQFPSERYETEYGNTDIDPTRDNRITTFTFNKESDGPPQLIIEGVPWYSTVPQRIELNNPDVESFSRFCLYLVKAIISRAGEVSHKLVIPDQPSAGLVSKFWISGDEFSILIRQDIFEWDKPMRGTPKESNMICCSSSLIKQFEFNDEQYRHKRWDLVHCLKKFIRPIAIKWWWKCNCAPYELFSESFETINGIFVPNHINPDEPYSE